MATPGKPLLHRSCRRALTGLSRARTVAALKPVSYWKAMLYDMILDACANSGVRPDSL